MRGCIFNGDSYRFPDNAAAAHDALADVAIFATKIRNKKYTAVDAYMDDLKNGAPKTIAALSK